MAKKVTRLAYTRDWLAKNRDARNAYVREVRKKQREIIIEAYGGVCSCPGCHVVHKELLTIDHVRGGRRFSKSTAEEYAYIIREGFPESYQLLCGSCNLAKGVMECCPLAGEEH